jgi:hypothetical protein
VRERLLTLSEAQERRADLALDQALDRRLTLMLSSRDVGPDARKKLKGLLKHYAKKRHPFRECVRDNTKRFGKEGAERVCATLKDIIRGTTKWRKGGRSDRGSKGIKNLSESVYLGPVDHDMPVIDDEVLELIEQLTDEELHTLVNGDD